MATILITCCPDDIPRQYGYFYLKQFSQHAAELGHRVVFLRNAYLDRFESTVKSCNPRLVIVQGHGGSKGVTGCGNHVILGIESFDRELNVKLNDENPELMAKRIVYLWTCFAGMELAPALIEEGAEAVAAFKSAYIFLTEVYPDGKAREFIEPTLVLPNMLVEGYSFGEASRLMRKKLEENLDRAEFRGDELTAKYLWHDLTNFITIGNVEARL